MANVFNVAWYILNKCGQMTTMKLQKLTYYCQAWSLAWDDVPLFNEDFQAWANGPVCKELFNKHQGKFMVDVKTFKKYSDHSFNRDQIDTMDAVIRDLGDKSPQWLSDLSHSESPWIEARAGCVPGEKCENTIRKERMQEYYAGLQ